MSDIDPLNPPAWIPPQANVIGKHVYDAPPKPLAKKKALPKANLKAAGLALSDEAYQSYQNAKLEWQPPKAAAYTIDGAKLANPMEDKWIYNDVEAVKPSIYQIFLDEPAKPMSAEKMANEMAKMQEAKEIMADMDLHDDFAAKMAAINQHLAVPAPPWDLDNKVKGLAPKAKPLPSLEQFVLGDDQMDDHAFWHRARIAEALVQQGWRVRLAAETIKKGDLIQSTDEGIEIYERVQGLDGVALTDDYIQLHAISVWTLEGGSTSRKPIVYKDTSDYRSIYDVPSGTKVKMPTVEQEAIRFYGCQVISTEIIQHGKIARIFYPTPTKMTNKRFRSLFSRVFSDFARNHFRECLKSVIPGRGEGIRMLKGTSGKKVRRLIAERGMRVGDKWQPLTTEQLYQEIARKTRLNDESISALLKRQDYQPRNHKVSHDPFHTFLERMNERELGPDEYKYDKAIGLEIECISTKNAIDLQRFMPHWTRVVYDGSLRLNDLVTKIRPGADHSQKELAKGLNGVWGVEFRILIERRYMEQHISRVANAIIRQGCSVNQSCGLHVHFDMRDKTYEEACQLAHKVNRWLMLLKELLPKARRNNPNCAFENPNEAHHAAVATDSYEKHKTIEVRVASATTNPLLIIQWIKLLDVLISTRFVLPDKSSCLDALKVLDLSDDARTFWLKRHHMLNPHAYGTPPDLSFLNHVLELE